jgi:urease accessory protein
MFEATHQGNYSEDPSDPGAFGLGRGGVSDVDLERANGAGRIVLTGSASGTRISKVYQKFPIGLMFPRIGDELVTEAVIVNSSGGIAGGDRLEIDVVALNNASVAVTTQAAEKVYKALDRPARIGTKLKVCGRAKLAWLPQETIVFNQARICRQTEIDLCSGAELRAERKSSAGIYRTAGALKRMATSSGRTASASQTRCSRSCTERHCSPTGRPLQRSSISDLFLIHG